MRTYTGPKVVMPDFTLPQRATYDDYRQFPDDGKTYELLDGEVYVTPSPSPRHQFTSKRLQRVLEDYFEERRGFQVFNAPLDVILSDADVVQPDLLVVDPTQISDRGIEAAPLLLVEILSPRNPGYDRLTKARRYATLGVQHYWIVDPKLRTLQCFELDGPMYRLTASAAHDEALSIAAFPGLTVSLARLWLE